MDHWTGLIGGGIEEDRVVRGRRAPELLFELSELLLQPCGGVRRAGYGLNGLLPLLALPLLLSFLAQDHFSFGPRTSGTSSSLARCSGDASGQFSRPSSAHIAAAASRDSSAVSFVYSTPRPHLHSTFGQWNTRMLVIMAPKCSGGERALSSPFALRALRGAGCRR